MDTGPQWWQVDLGTSQQEVRAIQLVNRADCCQDRLVGARVIVSSTSDYTAREGRTNCGSVTQAESEAGAESVIIKTCDPGTAGRYVTVAAVPDTFLALCEVAVFADCSAGGSGKASSLGANCHYSISGASGDGLNRADAEAACIANGGHLASVHSDADVDAIAALQPNGAWLGLSDLDSECGCDGDCFLWSDGTPNDYNNWGGQASRTTGKTASPTATVGPPASALSETMMAARIACTCVATTNGTRPAAGATGSMCAGRANTPVAAGTEYKR
jgi:hypothetical protein